MNFKRFLSSALALSLVASLPVYASETSENLEELDLDSQTFDTPLLDSAEAEDTDTEDSEEAEDADTEDSEEAEDADAEDSEEAEDADAEDSEEAEDADLMTPDMGVEDMTPDMGVDPEITPGVEEEVYIVPEFTDIDENYWGYTFIEPAVKLGFFHGNEDGSFNPDGTLTRVQFTVVMINLRNFEVGESQDGNWYSPFFTTGVEAGILPSNFTLENFNEPISREEMATMMIKTVGEGNFDLSNSDVSFFEDGDSISEEFRPYVAQAYAHGLISGTDKGFDPQSTATRVQGAIVSVAAYNGFLAEDSETATPERPLGNELSESFSAVIDSLRGDEATPENLPYTSAQQANWDMISGMLGFTAEQTEAFAVAMPIMNVSAYCVAVVKPAEDEISNIISAFEALQESKMFDFKNYLADQYEIAENAILVTLPDDTVIFVMHENAKEISDGIVAALTLG